MEDDLETHIAHAEAFRAAGDEASAKLCDQYITAVRRLQMAESSEDKEKAAIYLRAFRQKWREIREISTGRVIRQEPVRAVTMEDLAAVVRDAVVILRASGRDIGELVGIVTEPEPDS